jgi:hypothetical protein
MPITRIANNVASVWCLIKRRIKKIGGHIFAMIFGAGVSYSVNKRGGGIGKA